MRLLERDDPVGTLAGAAVVHEALLARELMAHTQAPPLRAREEPWRPRPVGEAEGVE